jgi:hypothetical protein
MHKIAISDSIIAQVKAQREPHRPPEKAINPGIALSAAVTDFA